MGHAVGHAVGGTRLGRRDCEPARRRNRSAVVALAACGLLASSLALAAQERSHAFRKSETLPLPDGRTALVGADYVAVSPAYASGIELRDMPRSEPWKPGDPYWEVPKRRGKPAIENPVPVNPVRSPVDPLLSLQRAAATRMPAGLDTPLHSFDAIRSGANPNDPNAEVGPNWVVVAINGSGGTQYTFYDKDDPGMTVGPITLDGLGSGPCAGGRGDPIMLYDELAGRWLLSEFSSTGNRLCVYVSQTPDPLGEYWAYDFQAPSFPDYPKYAVWGDAYYVGANEGTNAMYALDREAMLQGMPASAQRLSIPSPGAFGFSMMPPVDHDGAAPPPAGAPGLFIRHYDDEAHDPDSNDPTRDFLELYAFSVDFEDAANTTLVPLPRIDVAEFDSELCGFTSFSCFPQQGSDTTLDPLREVVMNLPKYRRFDGHESIVGNFVTDVDGTDRGGVRWFELRRTGGSWSLYQEGTWAPDDGHSRFMGASAIDASGNIALGYSITGSTLFPGVRYAGRLASDPLGTLTTGELILASGAGASDGNRWGDYASMSVDPVDGCTFWLVQNYAVGGGATRQNRVGAFRFDGCGEAAYTLSAAPDTQAACAPAALEAIEIAVGAVNGYTGDVDLATSGLPAGFSDVSLPATVSAPGVQTLVVDVTGDAQPGVQVFSIDATDGTLERSLPIEVTVATAAPPAPGLVSPPDGATGQAATPTLDWTDAPQAAEFVVEVDDDPGFASVDFSATVAGSGVAVDTPLAYGTAYFWRVRPANACGEGAVSPTFSFVTAAAPGSCTADQQAVGLYAFDFEEGAQGWTPSAAVGPDTFALSNANPQAGARHWHADDVAVVSDQRLDSPVLSVPADLDAVSLSFWHAQEIEAQNLTNCFDGAVLEVSKDGGNSFAPVDPSRLFSDPYDGPVSGNFSNPLAGRDAWCGDPAPYVDAIVDITHLAGEDEVVFRFRLGTDSSVSRPGWDIDEVRVEGCRAIDGGLIHADGFESP